ncbi:MAG: sugar transferase [Lachnospiraceae bacterium]|nr:sugar transferase [Lachnospiraceae bacterium]
MKNNLKKFETLMWMFIKWFVYICIMMVFMVQLAKENEPLMKLSRTMGITLSTYVVVGLLFLTIYGRYDVGRRKSKPIIFSLALATLFTDVIVYLQLMIMNTITTIDAFKFSSLEHLFVAYIIQLVVIVVAVYAGNELFFLMHKPQKCYVVTSSQENLDAVVRVISKYRKQYEVVEVFDYRDKMLLRKLTEAETVFLYNIPIQHRCELVSYCYKTRKNVYFNPEIEDIIETSSTFYILDDISMLNYNVKGLTMEQRIFKRCLDIGLSVIMGILTSPIWIVSAIAIKVHDGGSILFKQKRATINGRVFEVYKFRTMKENVDNRSVTEDDDRITKPGKVLRKFRIDEIPQFLNILKGDMSFVGPRPEMVENVESYTGDLPEFQYRLRVKAGLTGYAQISGKYNTSPKDKLMMDMMYIENYNVFKDIQLLFQTALVLLKADSTEAFRDEDGNKEYIFVEAKEEEIG